MSFCNILFNLFKKPALKPVPISTPMPMHTHLPLNNFIAEAIDVPVVTESITVNGMDTRILQGLIDQLEKRRIVCLQEIVSLGDRDIPMELALRFLTLSAILTYAKGLLPA